MYVYTYIYIYICVYLRSKQQQMKFSRQDSNLKFLLTSSHFKWFRKTGSAPNTKPVNPCLPPVYIYDINISKNKKLHMYIYI